MIKRKYLIYTSATLLILSHLASCQAIDNALIGVGGGSTAIKNRSALGQRLENLTIPEDQTSTSGITTGPDNRAPLQPQNFPATHPVPFSALHDTFLQRWNGQSYQNFYLKGINLGLGVPGTQAGDLAASREDYARWFQQMSEMGFNNIRIYTLHYPRFYQELAKFNEAHPDNPLYIFHGAWLDEEVEISHDLYAATEGFQQGIRENVDAIHGRGEIGKRRGRAYGKYTANISRWIAGWIIGREVSPDEIIGTNEKHPDKTRFEGKHVSLTGNPSEVWMAEQVDYITDYERSNYQVDRPISVSSWPTLDPMTHSTENPVDSSEDIVSVDLAQLEMTDLPGGYFPSFHAYPYYPNFINNEPEYLKFSDEQGVNNYLGYLKELKAHYKNMPLVIGEYGVPSSWGNAHFSPSGMHHGGLNEVDQARYNARMSQNIHDSGAAGGMVFAWIDEWWKRTWIVDEREMPRERFRLWHNLTSPEENFGMVAFEQKAPEFKLMQEGQGRIASISAATDAAYFYARVQLNGPLNPQQELVVGLDTYADNLGENILPNKQETSRRNEFAVVLNQNKTAQLNVVQSYDLLGIWHGTSGPKQTYQSVASHGAPWNPLRWQNGQPSTSRDGSMTFPLTYFSIGDLGVSNASQYQQSTDAVLIHDNLVEIRIPWNMLQFTDPSQRMVTHDDRLTPGRETRSSEGIGVSVTVSGDKLESPRYLWPTWDQAPPTHERLKSGLDTLTKTLKGLPN